jgi:hypothetical protein
MILHESTQVHVIHTVLRLLLQVNTLQLTFTVSLSWSLALVGPEETTPDGAPAPWPLESLPVSLPASLLASLLSQGPLPTLPPRVAPCWARPFALRTAGNALKKACSGGVAASHDEEGTQRGSNGSDDTRLQRLLWQCKTKTNYIMGYVMVLNVLDFASRAAQSCNTTANSR